MTDINILYLSLIILCVVNIYLHFKIYDIQRREIKLFKFAMMLSDSLLEHLKRFNELESKVDYSLNK